MNQYYYEGPVKEFDMCIVNNWEGRTLAVLEKKARSNLVYQFKKEYKKGINTKITLPGKLELIE
jgi:hypothetical protein